MSPLHERYPDLLAEQDDPRLVRSVADLDDTCAVLRLPLEPDAAIAHALHERATELRRRGWAAHRSHLPTWLFSLWHQPRGRLATLALALLLALGGVAEYLHLQSATPVSAAQIILRHAARAMRADSPDQVVHAVYTLTAPGGVAVGTTSVSTATLDTWIQGDASGGIARQAITFYTSTGTLLSHTIVAGQTATTYDAGSHTIITGTVGGSFFPNPFDLASLQQFLRAAQQGSVQNAHRLPSQTLDGVTVDVVTVSQMLPGDSGAGTAQTPHEMTATLYVDAHSYIMRGMDFKTVSATGATLNSSMLRLVQYSVVPLSAVPAHTFTLNAPATAHAVTPASPVQQVSVAQAVALPALPAPLLSGDANGLRLTLLGQMSLTELTFVRYVYQRGQKTFAVMIATGQPDAVKHQMIPPGAGQPLSLTVAGQAVPATYYDESVANERSYLVIYTEGPATVRLVGDSMSKDEFFDTVKALVDGHTHPALVAQLQRELDASRR